MTFSQNVLIAFLISVIAQATNTDLANNTNILLLLILALGAYDTNTSTCGNCNSCSSTVPRTFI